MGAAAQEPGGESYSRREQRGWYFYDWANSAFYTTVVTLFLGPYLTGLAGAAARGGYVYPLGARIAAASVWPFTISISVMTQVLALPLFGAIADYGRRKREMLAALAYIGSLATAAMYWLSGDRYLLGVALFLVANLAFGASIVIYNSFLPEIASAEDRDAVSSKGWGIGYLGGGLLLAANLALYSKAAALGIGEGQAVRISLLSAGVWWAGFTLIPLRAIRNRGPRKLLAPGEGYFSTGVRQLRHTLSKARQYPQTLLFLVAYLIYNDGIQTVITMSAQFGAGELHLSMGPLATAVLIAQFVAFFGALLFNVLARVMGSRRAVMLGLGAWILLLLYIYFELRTVAQFYAMAAAIGTILGGTQALSRSIYSLMIPKGQEAEYFSMYEISDKGTSWLGPVCFGLAIQLTGSYRLAILSLVLFFVIGLALLTRLDVRRAAIEAGNEPPARG